MDIEEIRKRVASEKEERIANARKWRREFFTSMKPFESEDDIPDVPLVDREEYETLIVPNLIRCGAIPKSQLETGARYLGSCRNFSQAVWNGKEFEGMRYKWGMWQEDTINHFEDDDGYDVFVPIKKLS